MSRHSSIPAILFIHLLAYPLVAQDKQGQDSLKASPDQWIEKMDEYANGKLAMTNDTEVFTVNTSANNIELYPNTSTYLRANVSYSFLSLGFKFAPSFFPGNGKDEREKGETKSISFGADLVFSHWLQSLQYFTGKGYFLNNTKDYNPDWKEGDPYIQFPNLHYFSLQGSTGYNFNNRFSVKSLTTQTERQLKNAGSFLAMITYHYYVMDNQDKFSATVTSTQKSDNFEFTLGAGYYYTGVIKKNFYVSVGATPGIGMLFMKLDTRTPGSTVESRQQDMIFRLDGRAAIGYNGTHFFSGLLLNVTSTGFEQESTHVVNSDVQVHYQLHVGYRFQAPKKLRNAIDNIVDAGKMIDE